MEFEDDIDALYATYQSLLPMAEADSARLWQKFRLDWNYNSNRIEGNSLTYGETEALLILGTEPKRIEKDIREMKAHDMGIEYLVTLADDERAITETDIRTLNQIILKENYWITSETAEGNISEKEIVPGTYKKMPNHVRLRGGGIHKFAEPNEVPARMETTVKMMRGYIKKQDRPIAAFLAELHQYFIQTHPFDDGNGRVVRMLLNYVCLKLGWPHIIIKDKNKKEYLASLEQWDKGNKADLVSIMKSELIWSLKKSIAAARGEDIDDPDDLDKEIDLFVRETSPNYDVVPVTPNLKFKIIDDVYILALRLFDEKAQKFLPRFDQINTPILLKAYGKDILIDENGNDEKIQQKFEFLRLNNEKERNSFEIIFEISFWQNAYEFSSEIIRIGGGGQSRKLRESSLRLLTERIITPRSILNSKYYDIPTASADMDEFIQVTLKKFLALLKSFPE